LTEEVCALENQTNMSQTLTSFQSDLNRIQTLAGTLSQVEKEHSKSLTDHEDDKLKGIAVAEQNNSRQLGEIKQLCLGMAQKIEEIQKSVKVK